MHSDPELAQTDLGSVLGPVLFWGTHLLSIQVLSLLVFLSTRGAATVQHLFLKDRKRELCFLSANFFQ